jgi:allantoinase
MTPDPTPTYPRDLRGYGPDAPHARWPGGARIALQFVLNLEEGGEMNPLHGDASSEVFLSEIIGAQPYANRHMSVESMYEYGTRAGLWRILREFQARDWPLTVFAVASALQRYPELVQVFMARGDEIASHGLRWVHHQHMPEATERAHIAQATRILRQLTGGAWPRGWYTGRDSPQTRRLVAGHGGYAYDSDHYGDDLPFWLQVHMGDRGDRGDRGDGGDGGAADAAPVPHLVLPYALDSNDMRFVQPQGFNTADHFHAYLRDSFDALYAEGDPSGLDRPKMLSIGMHCRLLGRPGRIAGLQRFMDHVARHDDVWVCRRIDIAEHWRVTHPFDPATAFVWRS